MARWRGAVDGRERNVPQPLDLTLVPPTSGEGPSSPVRISSSPIELFQTASGLPLLLTLGVLLLHAVCCVLQLSCGANDDVVEDPAEGRRALHSSIAGERRKGSLAFLKNIVVFNSHHAKIRFKVATCKKHIVFTLDSCVAPRRRRPPPDLFGLGSPLRAEAHSLDPATWISGCRALCLSHFGQRRWPPLWCSALFKEMPFLDAPLQGSLMPSWC